MWKDGFVWVARAWQNEDSCDGVRVLELKSFWMIRIVSRLVLMVNGRSVLMMLFVERFINDACLCFVFCVLFDLLGGTRGAGSAKISSAKIVSDKMLGHFLWIIC